MILVCECICFIHSVLSCIFFKIPDASSKGLDNLSVIGWTFWNSNELGQHTTPSSYLWLSYIQSMVPPLKFDKWIPKMMVCKRQFLSNMAVLGICLGICLFKISGWVDAWTKSCISCPTGDWITAHAACYKAPFKPKLPSLARLTQNG